MKRMQGYETLWMPGTDHAGIATQAVVERRLKEEENKTRHDLGREPTGRTHLAVEDEYEARILSQLKQMGCSCDWQRTRFTLDETCARAVRSTFFDLFRKGLIYRGKAAGQLGYVPADGGQRRRGVSREVGAISGTSATRSSIPARASRPT
jgi:valyl-tRNA synthetase